MNHLRKNQIHMLTLDVCVSCDTFWNYKFNIPIRIDDYYNAETRNINNIHNGRMSRGSSPLETRESSNTTTCDIGNIGRSDPMFCRLEEYLVDYVIQAIYDDLIQKRQIRDIPILLKKARKFHIHGRTLEDLLFPATRNGNEHMMPENVVYICTHC